MEGTPQKANAAFVQAHRASMRQLSIESALISAVKANDEAAVQAALRDDPGSIDKQDAGGNTALHLATSEPILVMLLWQSPDLTITNEDGRTAAAEQADNRRTHLSAVIIMFQTAGLMF